MLQIQSFEALSGQAVQKEANEWLKEQNITVCFMQLSTTYTPGGKVVTLVIMYEHEG